MNFVVKRCSSYVKFITNQSKEMSYDKTDYFLFNFMPFIIYFNKYFFASTCNYKTTSNQGVIEGQTATFYVEATGDTLTYQWYKDGVANQWCN